MHIISLNMLRDLWIRFVVLVRYRDGKMFVRWVKTYREYDDWCKLYRKGKV